MWPEHDPVEKLLRDALAAVDGMAGSDLLEISDKGGDLRHAADLVTEADLRVDEIISEGLHALYGGIDVVSEERPETRPEERGECFVLDPIDGTHNFVAGVPLWGISLARVVGAQVEEAWFLEGDRRRLYSAKRGRGAFCGGRKLRVTPRGPELTLLSVALSREILPLLMEAHRFSGVRVLGSHATALALAASGELGVHVGRGHPWDVAAGYLLLEEAGGKIAGLRGDERPLWRTQNAVAGAPQIVDMVLEILSSEGHLGPVEGITL